MSPALKANRHRQELLALREHLDAQLSQPAIDAFEPADWADRASQQTEADVNIGLVTRETILRKEIDDALERIAVGTFAICEKCHAVIGAQRLKAVPYARYCVRCERRVEHDRNLV
jgi:RNA polymerase-binding protein DksA